MASPTSVTGCGSIGGAVEARKLGAFAYLTKPIVDDEIRIVVEKAARQQSLLFENQTLRQQLDLRFGLGNVVGRDYRMLKIFDLAEAVADSRTTVLNVVHKPIPLASEANLDVRQHPPPRQ